MDEKNAAKRVYPYGFLRMDGIKNLFSRLYGEKCNIVPAEGGAAWPCPILILFFFVPIDVYEFTCYNQLVM